MISLASTTVDLARIQFAMTSLYHFLFVPLTLGLGPLVAIMQTIWHRTENRSWLRLTRFFGTLFLINFAVGVATGLVQEFQFGMNWSVYSKYVGDVFGAPLAIEGLAAFFLESTFLGLWIFGWNRLSPRVHLATIWLAVLGTWLSAYFILVANSWMQHPVGYKVSSDAAQLTSVGALLGNEFALYALVHTLFASLTMGAMVVFGIACWHFVRGRNVAVFRRAAALALVVLVPVSFLNLGLGSRFGVITSAPADEDLRRRGALEHRAAGRLLAVSDRRLLPAASDAEFESRCRTCCRSCPRAPRRQGAGAEPAPAAGAAQYGKGNYIPDVRAIYWSMRGMAYGAARVPGGRGRRVPVPPPQAGVDRLVPVGGGVDDPDSVHRRTLRLGTDRAGRQPWIVQGLLRT